MIDTDRANDRDIFRAMKQDKQRRHAEMFERNKRILVESGLQFIDRGQALLFRGLARNADFYLSTGRWKYNNRMYRGGAEAFLQWLRTK